jgi:hypothetical protein
MNGARIALVAGLGLIAIAIAVTLTRSPPSVAHTNWISDDAELATATGGASVCQAAEQLARDTSAIRLSLETVIGTPVTVRVLSGGRVVAQGRRSSGWTAASVTVPLSPLRPYAVHDASICFHLAATRGPVQLLGDKTPRAAAMTDERGAPLGGRMKIEDLRAGTSSWWSLAVGVARRMGLGHAASGTWLALLVVFMAVVTVALTSWVVVKGLP